MQGVNASFRKAVKITCGAAVAATLSARASRAEDANLTPKQQSSLEVCLGKIPGLNETVLKYQVTLVPRYSDYASLVSVPLPQPVDYMHEYNFFFAPESYDQLKGLLPQYWATYDLSAGELSVHRSQDFYVKPGAVTRTQQTTIFMYPDIHPKDKGTLNAAIKCGEDIGLKYLFKRPEEKIGGPITVPPHP